MSFNLEIISPQKIFFNDEIDLCILPGVEGDFGILKNHMPFLTTLRIGIAYVYKNKKLIETFLINGGVLEVNENKCTLLTEDIIKSDDFRKEDNDSEVEKEKIKVLEKLYYS
jgi:F-type H+-transporting ATPase subunit epsilon|tara:strand:- start:605 stop:940 length:336 start_codon:yes stop_codon:yes gene_type:complete